MTPVLLLALCFLGVHAFPRAENDRKPGPRSLSALALTVKSRPVGNRLSRPRVPPELWRMFRKSEESKGAEVDPCVVPEYKVRGNIVRYLQDQGLLLPDHHSSCKDCLVRKLFFNMTVLEPSEHLSLAKLEIRLQWNPLSHTAHLKGPRVMNVTVYHVLRSTLIEGGRLACHKLLLSQSVEVQPEPVFITLDITSLAKKWCKPGSNHGVILVLSHLSTDSEQSHLFYTGQPIPQKAALTMPTIQASLVAVTLNPEQCHFRKKRSTSHLPLLVSPICKLRRLYISFKDVGWHDFIIAPHGFMANYCYGECPFPLTEVLNGTNHAILQTLVHSMEPDITPQPCCIPIRMSPISLLYYDNFDNVVLQHYQDMVVEECGCR
ncbi:protein DVR-1 [Pholidichthys leucotaenia]